MLLNCQKALVKPVFAICMCGKNNMNFCFRKATLVITSSSNSGTAEGTHRWIHECEVSHLTEINNRKVMIVVMKFCVTRTETDCRF